MGSGKATIPVTDYFRSLHYGICHGPIDSINMIKVKDKPIWCGHATGQTDIPVDFPGAFGGDKKEGGVRGIMEFYSGVDTQLATTELADRDGGTPTTVPAHRHYASVFFRGLLGQGFKWGTNNPYMPSVEMNITYLPKALSADFSAIYSAQSADYPFPVGPVHSGVFDGYISPEHTGGVDLAIIAINPGGSNGTVPVQGVYPEWTLYFYSSGSAQVSGADYFQFPNSSSGIVKDHAIEASDFTDYELDNGVVTVTSETTFEITNFSPCNVASGMYALSALPDGSPDAASAVFLSGENSEMFGSFSSPFGDSTTITLSSLLPSGTRFIRVYSTCQENYGSAIQTRLTKSEVTVEWEELSYPHCPSTTDLGAGLGTLPNANPAHMIYELLTNASFGKGWGPAIIDTASFMVVAETLYNEKFGLFVTWVDRSEVNKVIAEILSHVQGNLYSDMTTGLVTLKLLRDDYDVATLLHATDANSEVKGFHRRTISETSNEIIVEWTNPANEQKETVRAQDLGNIAEQGGVVSTSRDYYAVRNAQLAMELAERDLTSMSALTASFTVHGSRAFREVNSGDVIKVDSPDDDVEGLIARVNKVSRDASSSLPVIMECVEDVFGLESAQYVQQPLTDWRPVSDLPIPFTNVEIQSAPYALMARLGVDTDAEFPRVVGMVAGEKPNNVTTGFDLFAPTVNVAGDAIFTNRGENNPTDFANLSSAWVREASTTVASAFFTGFAGSEGPEVGSLAIIGTGEATSELVLFKDVNSITGAWMVSRGMLDTIPREWAVGTPIWFINSNFTAYDTFDISVGEVTDYQLRSSTPNKDLSLFSTPVETYTWTNRASLPFRPANVTINGEPWNAVEVHHNDLSITWSTRDRTSEDSVFNDWEDDDVVPEVGQTAVVTLKDTSGVVLSTYAAATSPLTITEAVIEALAEENIVVWVSSDNGGLLSLQDHSQAVHVYQYPTSTQWRVNVSVAGGTGQLSVAEIEFRSVVGGADQATGGTAAASSAADPVTNAFDDDVATNWTVVGLLGGWVDYTFLATAEIREVAITSRNDAQSDQGPTDLTIEFFNGHVWEVAAEFLGEAAWGVTETRTYLI